ncbi:MAG TPA: hypothetical protein VHU89_18205 [Acidobacteriaceae bacterium]|nr:hypothetical protein [Acidobacteriaceae bacterium]
MANDDSNDESTWPSALDALVAAAAHHRLLLENGQVRVIEAVISRGDRTPDHTHRWPSVQYIRSWSDFIRRDGNGHVTLDTRMAITPEVGAVLWSEPYPVHSVENIGTGELRVIAVEIKTTPL